MNGGVAASSQVISNDSEEEGPGKVFGKVFVDVSQPFE